MWFISVSMFSPMTCAICHKVSEYYAGSNQTVIHEFPNSLLVLGEHQFFKYYCMVLSKKCVREVHHLEPHERQSLMEEVFSAGKFLEEWTGCKKINYSCLGNVQPHVHWHVFPRYADDSDFKMSPWLHFKQFNDHVLSSEANYQRVQELSRALKRYLNGEGVDSEY